MNKKYRNYVLIRKWIGLLSLFLFVCFKATITNELKHSQDLIRHNKIDSAIAYNKFQISKSKVITDKAFFYSELGYAYKLKQQYEKSLENYQAALQIFKKEKLLQEEFSVYTKLIEFYRHRRLYEKANEYLIICENILKKEKIKDVYLMGFYNRKAAMLSEFRKNKDSAVIYSEKSLALAQKLGDTESELISLMEIAGIYENEKKYTEAINRLLKIVNIAKTKDKSQILCDAMVNLSRNYILINNYNEAKTIALDGLDIAKKNKLSYNQLLFADNLQHIYKVNGDDENAYKYLKIRLELTEDYYHNLYDDKILEFEEKLKISEIENEIKENEKLIQFKEEEIKRQTLIKYFILIGLAISIVFTSILIYYIKIIRNQNKKLTYISEQNTFLVSETHHRINNNLQLVKILIENDLNKNPNLDILSKKRIIAKIDSMGILHRKLYNTKNKETLNLKVFLNEIRQNLAFLFGDYKVKANFEIDEISMPINDVMYYGLLLTELCINSLKHAFVNQEDKRVELKIQLIDKQLFFHYEDNGNIEKKPIIKLELIDKLCRQIRVEYKVDTEDGFKFNFMRNL